MEPVREPARFLLNAVCLLLSMSCVHAEETILAIRHAEKPPTSLGQLTCKGLNRALALPKVLRRTPGFGPWRNPVT
jgi:hypothetical protein